MPDAVSDLPHVDKAALPEMISPARTALLVIDIQTDFASPEGLIGQAGVDLTSAQIAIDRIEELLALARKVGVTIGFARVVTSPDSDSIALKTLMERRGRPGEEAICRAEGGGADYYRVKPQAGEIEISKLLYSSFSGTDLDAQLKARGVDTLVITGLTTDCCVDSTARDAFHLGYHVFLVSDACDAYDEQFHIHSLNAIEKNCALLTTADAVKAAWQR
ncbi:isochorismatase family protein [Altererythrobacter indicus]|uniref:Isochorismatase family protein n=1 Tax=Altericroceibacterium indicum TaxID=374177 RepID=A0A845A8T8_9SPHN|nr:cysteine hydrolase [Altericroceibacterium indicum]MXP24976.1 isochorismatase family protein [Altericroceibacterium indicum]